MIYHKLSNSVRELQELLNTVISLVIFLLNPKQ